MKRTPLIWVVSAISAMAFGASPSKLPALELPWGNLGGLVGGTPLDVPCPKSENQCRKEFCVERVPVTECVTGKKKVYETTIRDQYVAIPETRYRWVMKWVTKEIPADYCKTVCETEKVDHAYQSERWEKTDLGCSELHCKSCECKTEQLECKKCKTEPGKTTVKVHYFTCVKEPYTVYRQVKQEVCVKQPRYEKVEVPVTRYVCEHCGGHGCERCRH